MDGGIDNERAGQIGQEVGRSPSLLLIVACGVVACLVLMQLPLGRLLTTGTDASSVVARESIPWLIAALAIGWVVIVERAPLASLGWRKLDRASFRMAMWAAGFVSIVMIIQFFVILPVLGLSHPADVREHILKLPIWLRCLIVLRAAVSEEIIYRGFAIPRLEWLFRSKWAALIISTAAFAWAHVRGWGLVQVVPVGIAGLAFGLLFLARRSLPANIIAHFVTDAWGFLLA